jgi:EAL domain-containing protein (putative c-di-GMP-specific phosphodiesterase class I)
VECSSPPPDLIVDIEDDVQPTTTTLGRSSAPGIVAAIVVLAHRLGLLGVAEGVETRGTCDTLTAMGCVMQDHLVSRPLGPAQLDDWLATSDSYAWS